MNIKPLLKSFVGIVLLGIIATGCKKTIIKNYYCDCDMDTCSTEPPCTETSSWIGAYGAETSTYVADNTFIGNGIAHLSNSPYTGTYFTGYILNIPECRNYSADSIKFEARVKNPLSEGAIEELDVTLLIYGDQDSAIVNYVGRDYKLAETQLGLYQSTSLLTNVPELVQLFQDWTTVSLEAKNGILSTYRNGVLLKSYDYSAKSLGKLKKIQIGFKGTGSVDWVKVYDNSGTVRIKEEFNSGNSSHVEWF